MMTSLGSVALAAAATTEELTTEQPEANSHTLLGLGLMAATLLVIWLIRRLRA